MNTSSSTDSVMPTYGRVPLNIVKGEGAWLIDDKGERYFDAISGIAVCALGHSHPGFAKAIAEQARTLVHTSNLYHLPLQQQLAQRLCSLTGMTNAFFCNSGAEANEAAIKLARMHAWKKGNQNPVIVVMNGAFHGRTQGALAATHSEKYQTGFGPLPQGFVRVPYNDIPALTKCLNETANVCAVLVEPIQGEGGVIIPGDNYLPGIRDLCDEHSILLMLDEVQTGNGRTGQYFAFQHSSIMPDVISTAKGLGNGFPIGAILASGEAATVFEPGHHATTFGGSPLACKAAMTVYDVIEEESLLNNVTELGTYMLNRFKTELGDDTMVVDIRGKGMMIGIELNRPCPELLEAARNKNMLINIAASNTIRLLPALNTSKKEADLMIKVVCQIVRELPHER